MSRKCQKESKRLALSGNNGSGKNSSENNVNAELDVVVGSSNVSRWNELKKSFSCATNWEFATVLLDLAENYHSKR